MLLGPSDTSAWYAGLSHCVVTLTRSHTQDNMCVLPSSSCCMLCKHPVQYNTSVQYWATLDYNRLWSQVQQTTSDHPRCSTIRQALLLRRTACFIREVCHVLVWMICLKKIFAVFSPIPFRGRLVLGNFPSTQENHLAPQYWFQNNIQTTFTDKFKVCWIWNSTLKLLILSLCGLLHWKTKII